PGRALLCLTAERRTANGENRHRVLRRRLPPLPGRLLTGPAGTAADRGRENRPPPPLRALGSSGCRTPAGAAGARPRTRARRGSPTRGGRLPRSGSGYVGQAISNGRSLFRTERAPIRRPPGPAPGRRAPAPAGQPAG